jgi:amino acid transporter
MAGSQISPGEVISIIDSPVSGEGSARLSPASSGGHGFGTMPVFLAGISTILGAIMFLRFGYAVGHVGLIGALAVILLGHLVTLPTALALSEIATNRKVEGGGEYYIISRSFGLRIGSAIGLSLYLSQAISVAFYCIAFAEAFQPLAGQIEAYLGMPFDPRMVSIPIVVGLVGLMFTRGADMGVAALYVVVTILIASLVMFFLGEPTADHRGGVPFGDAIAEGDGFFIVFAICFPAFTGMTAGVGLSGDLKNPSRSIPLGTVAATLIGMVIYVAIVIKLAASATPEALAGDQLVMSTIAVWGPIIPIGLACATLSSAIGSILVAPRTLQAVAKDGCFPVKAANRALASGVGASNEPRTATLMTGVLAVVVVALGNVDFVARLISMFFMVTYGALCAISFLEHFASSPSYRPTFRSRWYVSLIGALTCILMMFQMDPIYAVVALLAMAGLYIMAGVSVPDSKDDLAGIFQGVMGQLTRFMSISLQRKESVSGSEWRPSVIAVSGNTFTGSPAPMKFLGWLCARHGFGTYLHYLRGMLERSTYDESRELTARLVRKARHYPGMFVDTVVSPSYRTALAQSLQIPGVSGMENNTILFDFHASATADEVQEVVDSAVFASVADKNLLLLRDTDRFFGEHSSIHLWLTWHDAENATLMTLLAYILVGHQDWRKAEISVFAAFPPEEVGERRRQFEEMMEGGRLPIRKENVRFHSVSDGDSFRELVESSSGEADLVILGTTLERLRTHGRDLLTRHDALGDVLFVAAAERVVIE